MRKKEKLEIFLKKYWVYIVCLIIFLSIRVSPISIEVEFDKIVNEIVIGAFASVLVALIIAVHDDNTREEDNRIILGRLVLPFCSALANYMQNIGLLCGLEEPSLKGKQGTFKDWYTLYDKLYKEGLVDKTNFEIIKSNLDNICESAERIKESEIILLKLGVISRKGIDEIVEISRIVSLMEMMSANYDTFMKNVNAVNEELNDYLSHSKAFKRLTIEKYGWDHRELTNLVKAIEQYSKK